MLPKDYTMVTSRVAFISKHAKNPNAGQAVARLHAVEARPGHHRQQGRSLLATRRRRRRGDDQRRRRKLIGDKARPVPIDADAAGESRPDQAAGVPGEVAAGEEGRSRAAHIRHRAPRHQPRLRRGCAAISVRLAAMPSDDAYHAHHPVPRASSSASPRWPWRRRCRWSSTRAS